MTISYGRWSGRLGNQLWEIASTLGIAAAKNDRPSFQPWEYEPFFSVPHEVFNGVSGVDATDCVPHLDPRARPYLQDFSLFEHVADWVKEFFAPSDLAMDAVVGQQEFLTLPRPILSVHVRRGDNVQANDPGTPDKHLYHPLRSLDYYRRAMESVGSCGSVAVFSDDIKWCRRNIPADYYHVGVPQDHGRVESPVDWLDLFLMSFADRHVLSNSTFGWWAAFLSNDPAPIYPGNWFGPKVSIFTDAHLMFPKNWVEIEDRTDADRL